MTTSSEKEELVRDGLLNVKQAAVFLEISVAGLYALMSRGELSYVKIGRSRRIPRRALIELAARNLVDRRNEV
jgi:excisionase family DNA binding protein